MVMQVNSTEQSASEALQPDSFLVTADLVTADLVTADLVDREGLPEATESQEPTQFHGDFASCMEMYADAATVERYLNAHQDWFPRCAHPMTAELISRNGYALTIGRFGSFGYEVEPKVGLDLLPQDQSGVYRIQTIPVPGYHPPGYEVDFQAALTLVEAAPDRTLQQKLGAATPAQITRVEWKLNLTVTLQFPRFIQALPKSLIQSTGDRLLNQIVRQVSKRLTHKVQEDFDKAHGICRKRKGLSWHRSSECASED